jgi:hypothetical protein
LGLVRPRIGTFVGGSLTSRSALLGFHFLEGCCREWPGGGAGSFEPDARVEPVLRLGHAAGRSRPEQRGPRPTAAPRAALGPGERGRPDVRSRHSAQNDARPVASDRHGTGRRQRPVQASGRASARWADRSSRRSSLASSTVTASPTALRTRRGRPPMAATTHSRWWTYSPPRASSHHCRELSRVDTSSWGSEADETGDRVGGFADLGVGCGAPFPDGVGDKSRWSTPTANGRSLVIHRRRVVRRVRRMAWRETRLIKNGARAADAAHVDACGRLRARRLRLALR